MKKEFLGEMLGTFILTFLGCSSVALAIIFGVFSTLFEIALIWGIAVTLAIFASRNLCDAHLNPAVTFGFWVRGTFPGKKVPLYLGAQLFGAFLAAGAILLIFREAIIAHELKLGIKKGAPESRATAMIFGEFFPNPGFSDVSINWWGAMVLEFFGTLTLVFSIFTVTGTIRKSKNLSAFMIGLTVTIMICIIAPFTQCGINPARDFGPRMVAYLFGWGQAALPTPGFAAFTVYILGPIFGGIAASLIFGLVRKG